jgi:hypothetical protein
MAPYLVCDGETLSAGLGSIEGRALPVRLRDSDTYIHGTLP